MKLKCLSNGLQVAAFALGAAVVTSGCSTKSSGGHYSFYASPSSAEGGTAEASESQSGTSQTSSNVVIPLYKESVTVGTRQVDDGTVRLRKIVKTETVNEPVQLRRETVVIDREPAATGRTTGDDAKPFQEQETVIQLHHDVPVVQTDVVPAGQIVAQTKSDIEQTNIQRQVRREEVTVEKPDNAGNAVVSDNVASSSSAGGGMGGGGEIGGQSSGAAETSTLTNPADLTGAYDPMSLNGWAVQFNGMKVVRVAGQLISVKDNEGRPLSIRTSESTQNIKPGDLINITGTVRLVSPSETNEALKGQQIYIEAQMAQPGR